MFNAKRTEVQVQLRIDSFIDLAPLCQCKAADLMTPVQTGRFCSCVICIDSCMCVQARWLQVYFQIALELPSSKPHMPVRPKLFMGFAVRIAWAAPAAPAAPRHAQHRVCLTVALNVPGCTLGIAASLHAYERLSCRGARGRELISGRDRG